MKALGAINVGDADYPCAMLEAKIEFDAWERDKRKGRKADKAKFKAQRLAKLEAAREFGDDNMED